MSRTAAERYWAGEDPLETCDYCNEPITKPANATYDDEGDRWLHNDCIEADADAQAERDYERRVERNMEG